MKRLELSRLPVCLPFSVFATRRKAIPRELLLDAVRLHGPGPQSSTDQAAYTSFFSRVLHAAGYSVSRSVAYDRQTLHAMMPRAQARATIVTALEDAFRHNWGILISLMDRPEPHVGAVRPTQNGTFSILDNSGTQYRSLTLRDIADVWGRPTHSTGKIYILKR